MNDKHLAPSKQSEKNVLTGPRWGRWSPAKRFRCAMRGHHPRPAVPDAPLCCTECGKTWDWTDLFQGRFPRGRWHSQRAYDDLEVVKEDR